MQRILASAAVLPGVAGNVAAQTLDDLKNNGKNTDNILTYGMGYYHRSLGDETRTFLAPRSAC